MKLLALVGVCALISFSEARVQSAGVRGTLMCGSKPLANTVVKLWDIDSFLDPDDLMGCNKTDSQGRFEVQGTEDEITNIDVRLKVYTDCNDRTLFGLAPKPCQRKIRYKIPDSYINSGRTVTKWYDFGVVNMEAKTKDEERKCSIFELC